MSKQRATRTHLSRSDPGRSELSRGKLAPDKPSGDVVRRSVSRLGKAIYPGSFDPVTNGHLDILERALGIFDHVVLAVADNSNKQGLFPWRQRCDLLREVVGDNPRVEIDRFSGLLVDYTTKKKASHVVRGLRALADFEYEFQMALINRRMKPTFDTVFLMTDEHHLYVSSSLVKEVARLGGNVSAFVPAPVARALEIKFG